MKKLIAMVCVVTMCMALSATALGTSNQEVSVEIPYMLASSTEEIARDDMTKKCEAQSVSDEKNCESVIIGIIPKTESIETDYTDILVPNNTRSTSKPKVFWNLSKDGIYYGNFEGVSGTIYTNYYFDWDDYCYYTRVDVSNNNGSDTRTFVVKNYCLTCGHVSSTKEYTTPFGDSTGYVVIKHSFTSKHDGHFMYPAVECTNSYGKIKGTIDVNYTNNWK